MLWDWVRSCLAVFVLRDIFSREVPRKKKKVIWNVFHSVSHTRLRQINKPCCLAAETQRNVTRQSSDDGLTARQECSTLLAGVWALQEWHQTHPEHSFMCAPSWPVCLSLEVRKQFTEGCVSSSSNTWVSQVIERLSVLRGGNLTVFLPLLVSKPQPGPPTWPTPPRWSWWLGCLPGGKHTCPRSSRATSTGSACRPKVRNAGRISRLNRNQIGSRGMLWALISHSCFDWHQKKGNVGPRGVCHPPRLLLLVFFLDSSYMFLTRKPEEPVWRVLTVKISFMPSLRSPLVQCSTLVSIEGKRSSRTSPTTSSDMITKKPWKSESKIWFAHHGNNNNSSNNNNNSSNANEECELQQWQRSSAGLWPSLLPPQTVCSGGLGGCQDIPEWGGGADCCEGSTAAASWWCGL